MKPSIQSFLTELYEIDPSLQQHEGELVELIEAMLKHDPAIDPDEHFVQMLRMKLQERAAALSSSDSSFSLFSFFTMPKFSYGIVGALLGILITGPVVYSLVRTPSSSSFTRTADQKSLFAYQVKPVAPNAFGELSALQAGGRTQSGGGGGGVPMNAGGDMAMQAPMADGQEDAAVTAPAPTDAAKMMIAPNQPYIQFDYSYTGGEFTLPTENVSVLKRIKGNLNLPAFDGLNSADLGILNLSAFPGLAIDSFTAYQPVKNGYMISISARDGSLGISQNWEMWDHPGNECRDEACFQRYRLKITDVPADDTLIKIAQDFLQSHGISLEHTGTPYVDNGWKISYDQMQNKNDFYVPDQMSVIFPYQVDGKDVHEQYGGKSGVSVGIDIRSKKVAGVWNLFTQSYESSQYTAVQDKQAILDYLAKMEQTPTAWLPPNAKVEHHKVELGTPTEGFVRMYKYENATADELFVPALVFPVTKKPEGKNVYFMRDTVVIPLAKDLFDQQNGNGPFPVDGPIRIMEKSAR